MLLLSAKDSLIIMSNSREKEKHSSLMKKYTLKSRQELIDFDYLDQLSDSELDFLNQFIAETVHTSFSNNPEIKRLTEIITSIVECPDVKDIAREVSILKQLKKDSKTSEEEANIGKKIKELTEEKRVLMVKNKRVNRDIIQDLENQIQEIRNQTLLYPNKEDHKEFYNANNDRNADIYNLAARTKSLFQLEPQQFDTYYSNSMKVDYELYRIDSMERAEIEELEALVYEKLRTINTSDSKRLMRKLDRCHNHEDVAQMLTEICEEYEVRLKALDWTFKRSN